MIRLAYSNRNTGVTRVSNPDPLQKKKKKVTRLP